MTRMVLIVLTLVCALLAGHPDRAAAVPAQASDRACFGAFASAFAQTNAQSGQLVSGAAQAPGPFGQTVSGLAQACLSP